MVYQMKAQQAKIDAETEIIT
jgi:hypothetical protein